ncbi:MAG TPA: type II toxin-antitoxin system VapB family antitoxin [Micropepsaceae bacterium]|nr:type II toxin-antitoxin system VapB family antitoxin [Micropepsaceae bacterium]
MQRRRDVYMMTNLYTMIGLLMRTNIEIDDELLSQAMTATGLSTKRATVEEGLRLLVRVRKQTKALAQLKGLGWEGDLDQIRQGRPPRRS